MFFRNMGRWLWGSNKLSYPILIFYHIFLKACAWDLDSLRRQQAETFFLECDEYLEFPSSLLITVEACMTALDYTSNS